MTPADTRIQTRARVVVDADACVPDELRLGLPLVVAPEGQPTLEERVPIPRLALERVPVEANPAVEACRNSADAGDAVLLVTVGDGYGGAPDAIELAGEAVRERGQAFASCATGQALMAAGWAAVIAAEAIQRGASAVDAAAAASRAAGEARLLAYLEHPELVGLIDTPSPTARAVVHIHGEQLSVLQAIPKRDLGLQLLRDHFGQLAQATPGTGALRVAVHHAGTVVAAQAMAQWVSRNTEAAQVVVAPLTRHAGARLGPGMVAMAWVHDPDFEV
jgi:fatty acid-binding protein DegV